MFLRILFDKNSIQIIELNVYARDLHNFLYPNQNMFLFITKLCRNL